MTGDELELVGGLRARIRALEKRLARAHDNARAWRRRAGSIAVQVGTLRRVMAAQDVEIRRLRRDARRSR